MIFIVFDSNLGNYFSLSQSTTDLVNNPSTLSSATSRSLPRRSSNAHSDSDGGALTPAHEQLLQEYTRKVRFLSFNQTLKYNGTPSAHDHTRPMCDMTFLQAIEITECTGFHATHCRCAVIVAVVQQAEHQRAASVREPGEGLARQHAVQRVL